MERVAARVIDEGHARTQVEVDRRGIAGSVAELPDHVEHVEAHEGTVQYRWYSPSSNSRRVTGLRKRLRNRARGSAGRSQRDSLSVCQRPTSTCSSSAPGRCRRRCR